MNPGLPNLIIAGVTKGGTTSLFRYLAQHPDIFASSNKELRYFMPLRYGEALGPEQDYARNFVNRGDERYALEATPGYFYGGRALATGIERTLERPHVVLTFRDPAQRCWSWFRFVRARARIPEDMTFEAYLDRCELLHRTGVDGRREQQPFWGLGGGCYDQWIDSWIDVLGDRLRVEFFEDLGRSPGAMVAGICRWLRIDENVAAGFRYDVENRTVQYRNKALQHLAIQFNRRTEALFEHRRGAKRSLRRAYYLVNGERAGARMDDLSRERLAAFYAPHNERFADSLVRAGCTPLPGWLRQDPSTRVGDRS